MLVRLEGYKQQKIQLKFEPIGNSKADSLDRDLMFNGFLIFIGAMKYAQDKQADIETLVCLTASRRLMVSLYDSHCDQ